MYKIILFSCFLIGVIGCQEPIERADAFGNFEATYITVSAQGKGQLLKLDLSEGQKISSGVFVGYIDTTSLILQRNQVEASLNTLPKRLKNTLADIEVLNNQKSILIREKQRLERLIAKKAATRKQLDDIVGQIEVLDKRIQAIRSNTNIGNRGILAEKEPLLAQKAIINDQIRRCYISNPITGTIITKLVEPSEMVSIGMPLYRLAKLDTMTLRFYVDAVQLQELKIGQSIQVLVDKGVSQYDEFKGIISWIAEQAEFTPKTIQTKEDRVNLVYALKAKVDNPNGSLKMGMPAEVNFNKRETISEK